MVMLQCSKSFIHLASNDPGLPMYLEAVRFGAGPRPQLVEKGDARLAAGATHVSRGHPCRHVAQLDLGAGREFCGQGVVVAGKEGAHLAAAEVLEHRGGNRVAAEKQSSSQDAKLPEPGLAVILVGAAGKHRCAVQCQPKGEVSPIKGAGAPPELVQHHDGLGRRVPQHRGGFVALHQERALPSDDAVLCSWDTKQAALVPVASPASWGC